MKLSSFGTRFSTGSGILSLMDDLGNAMAEGNMIMMGGGNPGHNPEIQEVMRQELGAIIDDPAAMHRLIGTYDPPQGEKDFVSALAGLLQREFGWQVGPENICVTNGSQAAFFLLFNLFAGPSEDGVRRILLPISPEYIGYADLGLTDDFFQSFRPRIEEIGPHRFKYRVDFDQITVGDDIGAICVSRPNNPTGNVLTDDEIQELARLARHHHIPLIIDNAYGLPFPGILYRDATPIWNEDIILSLSLSKFGLPAVRTGIIVARTEIIRLLAGVNSILNLAPGSFGAMLTTKIIDSGEIIRLSQEVVRPYYQMRMERALTVLDEAFAGLPYRVHVPEGAMFLWLWLPGLPISSRQLYQRLKQRRVLVVSGDYFFPGVAPGWRHMQECLRLTYSQDPGDVEQGIRLIADEVRKVYHEGKH
jgi:valine--pyruvate aminotransferase